MAQPGPNPAVAPDHVFALLDRLHELSLEQESRLKHEIYNTDGKSFDDVMRDKFIALEQDKCQFVYQIARIMKARNIVEAGTSFGVSTIYLALAVGQNVSSASQGLGKVIATEMESTKIATAKEHWREAGDSVEPYIELREGNLLETLKDGLPDIDMLLLDIWAPLALPTLKLVQPRLKPGAVVIVDNTVSSADRYQELLQYLRKPSSGFKNLTLPYHNGLELCVYFPL